MNLRLFVIPCTLLIALRICACGTQGQGRAPSQIPALTAAQQIAMKKEIVIFVKEVVACARPNRKEKAPVEFSIPKRSVFRGVLYICAYDTSGTTITHPVNPDKTGVNRMNGKDIKGNLFIENLRQAVIHYTCFALYFYINPASSNMVEKMPGHAMKSDDSWWLGSGICQNLTGILKAPATGIIPAAGITPTLHGR